MRILISILSKTVVRSFYKEFALFFLIGLYISFGLFKSSDHIFLNTFILSSSLLISLYFLMWTLYNILIISFFTRFLRKRENIFLYHLSISKKASLYLALFFIHLYLFAPAIAYAVFVSGIAVNLAFYNQLIYILLFVIVSGIYPVLIYKKAISSPDISLSNAAFLVLNFRFKKPYFSFFFFHLFENEWLKLLISKGLSAILLLGLVQILQTDNDDIRPLLVVVLMGFLPNFALVGSYYSFENVNLLWFRNLPILRHKKWLMAVAIFAILLLPELFLLYRYAWDTLPIYVPIYGYLFGVSLMSLYYSGLYLKIAAEERFSNLIFIIAIFCFLAILFKINVLAIIFLVFFTSIITFFTQYYHYELVVKNE